MHNETVCRIQKGHCTQNLTSSVTTYRRPGKDQFTQSINVCGVRALEVQPGAEGLLSTDSSWEMENLYSSGIRAPKRPFKLQEMVLHPPLYT